MRSRLGLGSSSVWGQFTLKNLRKHGMTILHSLDNGELGISSQSESIQQTRMKLFFWQISSIGEDQGVAARALLRDICQTVGQVRQLMTAVEHDMSL